MWASTQCNREPFAVNNRKRTFTRTDAAVTCKRCIKVTTIAAPVAPSPTSPTIGRFEQEHSDTHVVTYGTPYGDEMAAYFGDTVAAATFWFRLKSQYGVIAPQLHLVDDFAAPTFELFMATVDAVMGHEYGITSRDIADWHWYDSFDSGDNPVDAATDAIANELNS
jgi:hypothetical protein